jgi:hypothetical protein
VSWDCAVCSRPLFLLSHRLVGSRIDDEEKVSLLDHRPFLEVRRLQIAAHTRADTDMVHRLKTPGELIPLGDHLAQRLAHAHGRRRRLLLSGGIVLSASAEEGGREQDESKGTNRVGGHCRRFPLLPAQGPPERRLHFEQPVWHCKSVGRMRAPRPRHRRSSASSDTGIPLIARRWTCPSGPTTAGGNDQLSGPGRATPTRPNLNVWRRATCGMGRVGTEDILTASPPRLQGSSYNPILGQVCAFACERLQGRGQKRSRRFPPTRRHGINTLKIQ